MKNLLELKKEEGTLEGQMEALRQQRIEADEDLVVNTDDIAEIIAMWTGIPMTQLAEEESQRLLEMETEISQTIVGQPEAIETIAKAVRRARAGLKDPRRPIGSFIFLGPTGVGKTELSKALARVFIWFRRSPYPIGYVRIYGTPRRRTSGRCASRLCGL